MSCWPANVSGAFLLALLIFDMVVKDWNNLPNHALFGVIIVGALWLLCKFLGSGITGAVIVVPGIALLLFFAGILFTGETLRRKGCCVRCNGGVETTEEKKDETDKCTGLDTQLKATPL